MLRFHSPALIAASALSLLIVSVSSSAEQFRRPWNEQPWEPAHPRGQSVVIALKTDPLEDPEAACVALQIGSNLLMNRVPLGDFEVDVEPAREVTLFPTLAGVQIINPEKGVELEDAQCTTQSGPMALSNILAGFINSGGQVVVCGLCATERGITSPTYGAIGNAQEVHELFLYADKVIDF